MAKTQNNTDEERVYIKIPFDELNPQNVIVWVNNKRYSIKKGEYVRVPLSVADILQNKENMEVIAQKFYDKIRKKLEEAEAQNLI